MREIVRDPDIFDGRWRIDGTLVFVADLQRDFLLKQNEIRDPYKGMGLTDDEINAALIFMFPAVVKRELDVTVAGIKARCECGERRRTHIASPEFETDACICGRLLRIQVELDAILHTDDEPENSRGGRP